MGGGVDFPNECFFGEDLFSAILTEGRDTGCLTAEAETSFLSGVVGTFFLAKIFSELPVNFSRLELVDEFSLVFNGAGILLAPVDVLEGFLVLASSLVVVVVVVVGVLIARTKLSCKD